MISLVLIISNNVLIIVGIIISIVILAYIIHRESPGKFESRTLNRKTLNRWTGSSSNSNSSISGSSIILVVVIISSSISISISSSIVTLVAPRWAGLSARAR